MQARIWTHQTACKKGELCLPATLISRPLRRNQNAIGKLADSLRRSQDFRAIVGQQIKCRGESDADRLNASTAVPLSTVCDVLLLLKVPCILLQLLIFTEAASKLRCGKNQICYC